MKKSFSRGDAMVAEAEAAEAADADAELLRTLELKPLAPQPVA